jgi:hypothetical protein
MKDSTEQNGGIYHAELTKLKCTHLVAVSAEGDKYAHAVRWRSIKIVSPAWFEKSIAAKRAPCLLLSSFSLRSRSCYAVCLAEALFPVSAAGGAAGGAAAGEPRRYARCCVSAFALLARFLMLLLRRAAAAPSTDEALCGTADMLANTGSFVDPLYLSSCRVLLLGFGHPRCAIGKCCTRCRC